jgi:hypothetical protein
VSAAETVVAETASGRSFHFSGFAKPDRVAYSRCPESLSNYRPQWMPIRFTWPPSMASAWIGAEL